MTYCLVTVPFSHYCEKARWALDLAGLPYAERAYLPGLHLLGTKMRGRGRSVPVLAGDGQCLTDSTDILHFADAWPGPKPRLYAPSPPGEAAVADLEHWLDEELGPPVRLLAYRHLLADPARFFAFVDPTLALANRLAFRALLPGIAPKIRALYQIDAHSAAAAETKIRAFFGKVDGRLADGRPHLAGTAFSAADLTLAALAGPLLAWPGTLFRRHGQPAEDRDPLEHFPPKLAALSRDLRATVAGEHCRRVYRDWRHPLPARGEP